MTNLTDEELIKRVEKWNSKLCSSNGKAWMLCVPAEPENDPDFLIQELCDRYRMAITPQEFQKEVMNQTVSRP